MTDDEKFEYKSEEKSIKSWGSSTHLSTSMTNGLECIWRSCNVLRSFRHRNHAFRFSWDFNWDKLKTKGIDRLSGYIILKPSDEFEKYSNNFVEQKIDVVLEENHEIIEKCIESRGVIRSAMFEYSLIPHYTQNEEIKEESLSEQKDNKTHSNDSEEMFTPSEQNDTILVIDGKNIHVNKTFLYCHSEFFRNLFTLDCKDGKMKEIPIGGISYDDFKLLIGPISPKPVFPTDETVEKLLELATRFKIPYVIHQCEYYLLHVSKMENEKKILMAEKYGMTDLLEKSILQINTMEKAKKWKETPEYTQFSDTTKIRVLEKFF